MARSTPRQHLRPPSPAARTAVRRPWAALLWAALLCATVSATAATGAEKPMEPAKDTILEAVGFEQKPDAPLPLDLAFRDETGRKVRLGSFFDKKPVILALAYYECPMLCTMVLNGLGQGLEGVNLRPGKDFHIVVASIDSGETPAQAAAKKKVYVERFGKGPESFGGWHFLTGDGPSIEALAEAVGFGFAYVPEEDEFAHPSGIVLATPKGRISRYLLGIEYRPRDLRLGLVEASRNTIGGLAEKILLMCYRYDPTTGRYTATVRNALKAGGLLTVSVLFGGIWVMLRRERRGHAARKVSAAAGEGRNGG